MEKYAYRYDNLVEITDRLGYETDPHDVTVSDDLDHRMQFLEGFIVQPESDESRADGYERRCGGCNFWFDLRDEGIDQEDPLRAENIVLCDDCRVK